MKEKIVVDAYAWVEYLEGANRKVADIIRDSELHTSIVNVAEVASKAERTRKDSNEIVHAINQLANIWGLDVERIARVGQLHAEMRKRIKDFGLGDCFVLELAERLNAKILTGDSHFKGLENVILI
jgi:predicted nucleic acid-binding protein